MNALDLDAEKCTACRACELVCSFVHERVFAPSLSRIRVVRLMERGLNVPVVCVNCDRAPCVDVCPTGAVFIDRTVPVIRINEEECVGCRQCVVVCPFGAADYNDEREVAFICDLCDGEPVCIANCIYGALSYAPAEGVAQHKRRVAAQSRISQG